MGEACHIRTDKELETACDTLRKKRAKGKKFKIEIIDLAHRSLAQNNLSFGLYQHISLALGDQTAEEVRAECKLRYGIPILRRDNEKMRASYDKTLKPLSYESKLELIEMFQLPVTSLMNKPQKSEYVDLIFREYGKRGVTFNDF